MAKAVTVLENHGPRVEPDMGRRWAMVGDTLDDLEGCEHCSTWILEIEHHTLAQPLGRLPSALLRGPLDQARQPSCKLRSHLIRPALLLAACIP